MDIHHPCYDEDYIDLTAMDYDAWVQWLFTTDHQQWHHFCVQDPEKLLEYATRLFTEFAKAVKPYTHDHIEGALWFLFGAQLELGKYLMDTSIPLSRRIACLRSMYHPFADYLTKHGEHYNGSGFFMWWDLIVDNYFWGPEVITLDELQNRYGIRWKEVIEESARSPRPLKKTIQVWEQLYRQTNQDHRELLDEALRVLKRILELDEPSCVGAALHGLGHLWHPESSKIVQAYIDKHRAELEQDPEWLQWIRRCRDGVVM